MAGKKDSSETMRKLQEQLARLDKIAHPPGMHAVQKYIDRFNAAADTPAMRAVQEAIDRMNAATDSPAMRAAQEHIDRMNDAANTPAMRAVQEAIDRMNAATDSPAMRAVQEHIDRISAAANSPAMRVVQEHIDRMSATANSPGMRAFQEQVERMAAAANDSRVSDLLARTVVSLQELTTSSVLANYLLPAQEPDQPDKQSVDVENFENLEIGDWAELEIIDHDDIDHQIVQAIKSGQVEQLPEPAAQRLQFVLARIVVVWDMLMRIFNTCMAVIYLSALMSTTTAPSDIHKLAEQLPNEQKELLSDYRIVNREGARLRAEATTNSQILRSLKLGTLVEVIEYNDEGWYRVAAMSMASQFKAGCTSQSLLQCLNLSTPVDTLWSLTASETLDPHTSETRKPRIARL